MLDVRWLEELSVPVRWTLVGAALGVGAVGTLWPATGVAAVGLAAGVLGGLGAAYGIAVVPHRGNLADPLSERDRGILARRAMQMVEDDPGFSLPQLVELLRAELLPTRLGGPVELGPVVRLPRAADTLDTLELAVAYQTPARSAVASVGLVRAQGHWSIDHLVEPAALPSVDVDPPPWLLANRRSLLARSEAFDQDAFEAQVKQISRVLDHAESDDAIRPYTTPAGLSSVRWWRTNGGLPGAEGELSWVDVLEDAWYERVDLRIGDRVLGLLRPIGAPDEPWRLWRLRGAA